MSLVRQDLINYQRLTVLSKHPTSFFSFLTFKVEFRLFSEKNNNDDGGIIFFFPLLKKIDFVAKLPPAEELFSRKNCIMEFSMRKFALRV